MNIKLTKEQQEVVDRIKVEGKFEELYYSGPLRRGRVVVRCEGMEGDYRFNYRHKVPSGVGVLAQPYSNNIWAVGAGRDFASNYTNLAKCDHNLAASQIIEPYSDELDWSGVDKDGVDIARRILDNPESGNNDVGGLFFWSKSPQGPEWWGKQHKLYRDGTLTPELQAALESYIAYVEGVTPTAKEEDVQDEEPETLTIKLDDLRSIVQYGFEPSDAKLDAFIELVKGVAV